MDDLTPAPKRRGRPPKNPQQPAGLPLIEVLADDDAALDVVIAPRYSEAALQLRGGLSFGDRGAQVELVQRTLSRLGLYEGPIDGRYGTRLSRAVRQYQSRRDMRVTGDINKATWVAIVEETT